MFDIGTGSFFIDFDPQNCYNHTMKQHNIKEIVADMRSRINSLETALVKMEQSGKFDPDDPRFESIQNQIWHMTQLMTNLSLAAGDRPYKLEHPSLDKPRTLHKKQGDQDDNSHDDD